MMQNDTRQPQEPTEYGYVTRIVLQILRDAEKPLSCRQIEQRAALYTMEVKTAKGIVAVGGHTITDSRDVIRSLKRMGYDIHTEYRYNRFGKRYGVHSLNVQPKTSQQLSIFDIEGV